MEQLSQDRMFTGEFERKLLETPLWKTKQTAKVEAQEIELDTLDAKHPEDKKLEQRLHDLKEEVSAVNTENLTKNLFDAVVEQKFFHYVNHLYGIDVQYDMKAKIKKTY